MPAEGSETQLGAGYRKLESPESDQFGEFKKRYSDMEKQGSRYLRSPFNASKYACR